MLDTLRERLLRHLEQLPGYFMPNELAFLAATAPPEAVVRDKLAFRLHEDLGERYTIARDYRALELPGAATLAILERTGEPLAILDLRSATLPAALATNAFLLSQSLQHLTPTVPEHTQWYHVFLQHLPQVRLDAPWSAFSPTTGIGDWPPTLQAWMGLWQDSADRFQHEWLDQWKRLAAEYLGFDPTRIEARILQGGSYYFTRQQLAVYLCGPFTVSDNLFHVTSWQSKSS